MKAGKTQIDVNTRIRITMIPDLEDQIYVGLEGTATHPFPGLMYDSPNQYTIGVWLDAEQARTRGLASNHLGQCTVNLTIYDEFEVITAG